MIGKVLISLFLRKIMSQVWTMLILLMDVGKRKRESS